MENETQNIRGEDVSSGNTDLPKTTSRTLRVDQVHSKKDHNVHFVPTSRSNLLAKQRKFSKYALVVRRIIGKDGKVSRTEIDVKSLLLRDVLLELNKYVEGLELNKSPPMADPELFYHSFKGLKSRLEQERTSQNPDENLINDLSEAIGYVVEDFGPSIDDIASLLAKGETTYDYLWALFRPGTLLYTEVPNLEGIPQVLLLRSGQYISPSTLTEAVFSMQCWTLTHDGIRLGHSAPMHKVFVDKFLGSKLITDLPIFPFEYHPYRESLRPALIKRGREFLALLKPSYREYTGPALMEKLNQGMGRHDAEIRKFISHGRVMIDPTTFLKYNTFSILTPRVRQPKKIDALTDDDLLICTPIVLGFSFGSKCWGAFSITDLKDVEWNATAFDKLVLNPQHSKVVLALVKAHSSGTSYFDDIVQNKGKGLIGLLSGPPGVGKTLTAEAVAEATHRPLYMLSAGELGMNALEMDKNLRLVLELSDRWDSVLLLDEADAFLHERNTRELMRNSLVAIFLRQLEYYQGIMILTTNRVHAIDTAFHSRIHFSINYPELNKASRLKIWNIFISKIQADADSGRLIANGTSSELANTQLPQNETGMEFNISDAELLELAENLLNGRQIKNTIASAFSLARYEGIPLNISHIKTVIDIIGDFAAAIKGKSMGPNSENDLLGL